jgi:tetratricopeptide (TPR) repeat protein
VLDELEIAHPGLRALATQLDVRLLGHAMTRPTPGLVHGVARAAASGERPHGVVHFAHSDLSALPLFEESLAMLRRLWGGRDHSDVSAGLNNLARVLQALGRLDDALPLYEESLAVARRLHGDVHADVDVAGSPRSK